jgi:cysteine desulfurase
MTQQIYLDYAATTPLDPRVADCMIECLRPSGAHGNPSSAGHEYGLLARLLV